LPRLISLHCSIINAALHNCTDDTPGCVIALAQRSRLSVSPCTYEDPLPRTRPNSCQTEETPSGLFNRRFPARRNAPLNTFMTILCKRHEGRGRPCPPTYLPCSPPSPGERKDLAL
jgi:hypothetical protein